MNNGQTPGRQLDRYNTRRSSIGESHKPYEHMLLKELPGVKRTNAAMHAVLESALEDNIEDGMHEAQKVRNHALIHYLASLANSNNNDDIFDFDFVQSLIENGADVNSTDRNGQTIFHEVARSWNLDVALFLLEHGANLNQQDKFGRSPLHVAAAVDYADMVRFLVKHGANINIATYGEQQFPIHYAAKNDACKSLKMLLGYGANIDSRDSKNRTPLQVAAEMNRAKSAKLLVQHGAPAGVHDNVGNSALSLLIEKLPDVAIEALDQFHSVSTINRKEFFFLNYLEGNRLQNPKSPAYSALEIAVQSQEFDIILHPVMKRLIDVKWQQFGRKGAVFNLCLNLLYAILWTILAVTSPTEGDKLYLPWSRKAWRLVISVIVCLMTIDEIRKQITGTLRTRNHQRKWISWRASELEEDLQYCHPRWPQEEIYLRSEIKSIRDTPLISSGDSWIYFDWFSLILILGTIASHVVFFNINSVTSQIVHARIIIMLLMVLWIRIMQYARPFEGAGPFVAIFAHIINDIINWGILTLLITVPYACAFWITFGDASRNPVKSYSDVSSLIYGLFSMIVVNDHDFEALQAADATMARLLCGSYIGLMAIINLNILIALLSDTFTRVYGNAVANAIMQRAKTILFLEKSLTKKSKREYGEFIKNFGSPETIDLQRDISANNDRDEQKAADMLKESVQEIHNLIHERFGKRYGEGKKSDLDHIRESLEKIHQGTITRTEKCGCNGIKRKVDRIQEVLVRISYTLKVDISGFGINQQSSSDDDDDDDDTLVGQIDEEVESNQNSNWKERTEGWKYETGSQATARNVEGRNPEQQFWSASKAAFNEAYQFEDAESTLSRNARGPSGVASAGRRSYYQSDYKERGGRNQNKSDYRKRRSSDFDQTNRRKFGSIDVDQMSEDEEFISDDPRDTGVIPYKQARDGAESYIPKADRRPFRTEVYQKRLTSEGEEKVSNRVKSNSLREIPKDFMDKQRVLSRQRLSEKRSPRKEVRRAESMPQRLLKNNQLPRRAKESYYTEVGARRYPQKNITESFRREIEEKRRKRRSSPERLSRAHFQNRRDSGSLKRRSTRQRSPNTTLKRKPNERIGEAPEEYYDERQQDVPYKRQSATDSDVTESDIPRDISFEDSQNIAYSDNDVIQTRASRLRERRLLEDWDNRSVKSVAF